MTPIIGMTSSQHAFDQRFFRSALSRFPTGVTVIVAQDATGNPIGMTISSFNSLSLDPPLILWTLKLESSSMPHMRKADGYVVHVLSESQQALAQRFARGPQHERFQGIPMKRSNSGLWMLDTPDCSAWFVCHNHHQHEAGDHAIFIGAVSECAWTDTPPRVYHSSRFHHQAPVADSVSN